MRLNALSLFLLCSALPTSPGQTVPGLGTRNSKPLPPIVVVRPEVEPGSPDSNHKRLLAEVEELINEAKTLQEELHAAPAGSLPAQSFKRSQRIESLSKTIRKTLKQN